MNLPDNVTEAEFLAATEKVTSILAASFTFGYFDIDDMKQQARFFAIQAMKDYDPSRPLDNFLYSHIKNRLINFRRDKFRRNDPPCYDCHVSMPGHTLHPDKQYCERYAAWMNRNIAKQNIMNTVDITNISDEREPNMRDKNEDVVEDVAQKELLLLIDLKLDNDLRQIYLQMKAGNSVPKSKRQQVEKAILEIIGDNLECLYN